MLSDISEKLEQARQEAREGMAEGQAFLGKYLLKQAECGIYPEENGSQAVDWLIKSSKQGNTEATTALQECMVKGIGENIFTYMLNR